MNTNINKRELIKCIIIVVIFIFINIIFSNVIGLDYYDFLSKWIEKIRNYGKINSLSVQIGNYTPPYIYFLILGTYITTNNIFWIKLVSNIFTIAIVIVTYFILKEFKKDIKVSNALLILLIPSVLVNSCIIGQCDSIYTFFILLFILLVLKNKKRCALVFFGVALAFKLQTIIVAPILLYLLLKKKIKIIDIIYIPIGYILTMLPAILYGRSIIDIIKIELLQVGEYAKFVKSAPNIYSLLHLNYVPLNNILKFILSFFTVLLSVFIVLKGTNRREYDNKTFLEKIVLLSLMVPYFLPSMHDRYFYMANILCYIFLIFVYDKSRNKNRNISNVIIISISSSLPVILYNFVSRINELCYYLSEIIGVSIISSILMTYLILLCFNRYLLSNNVTKKLQRKI